MTLENWIFKRARLSPHKLAFIFEEEQWTFEELYRTAQEMSDLFATVLDACGGINRVGIFSNNSAEMYVAILACMNAGIEMVLLNTRLSAEELTVQINDASLSLIFCANEWLPRLSEVNDAATDVAITCLSLEWCYANRKKASRRRVMQELFPDDQVMSVLYTSGTTGKPKGVMQSYGNHYASAMASVTNLGFHEADMWVAITPLYHVSGLSVLVRGLVYGMPVHLFRRFDAALVNQALLRGKGSIISVVSYTLSALLKDLGDAVYPDSFRLMLLGGGFVDRSLLAACQEKRIAVVQSFGMTETCSQIAALPPRDISRKMGSAGLPLFSNRLRIGGTGAGEGGVGEIQIQSPALCVGYLGQNERYQRSFTADGWYRTGDMGYLDEEGYLYVKCRLADCIISGGENIYPVEIETCLKNSRHVREAAVVGKIDATWGMVPWAFLVAGGTGKPTDEELKSFCLRHLAAFKVPKRFVWVDELPKTAVGKIQKYKLLAAFAE